MRPAVAMLLRCTYEHANICQSIVCNFLATGPSRRLSGVGSDGRSLESREEPTACMDGIVRLSDSLLAPGGFVGPRVQLKISELLGVIAPPSAGPKRPWQVGARRRKKQMAMMGSGQPNDSPLSIAASDISMCLDCGCFFNLQSFFQALQVLPARLPSIWPQKNPRRGLALSCPAWPLHCA